MERKIGEIFKIGEQKFQCVERLNFDCVRCGFIGTKCWNYFDKLGACDEFRRTDGKNVIFRLINVRIKR